MRLCEPAKKISDIDLIITFGFTINAGLELLRGYFPRGSFTGMSLSDYSRHMTKTISNAVEFNIISLTLRILGWEPCKLTFDVLSLIEATNKSVEEVTYGAVKIFSWETPFSNKFRLISAWLFITTEESHAQHHRFIPGGPLDSYRAYQRL